MNRGFEFWWGEYCSEMYNIHAFLLLDKIQHYRARSIEQLLIYIYTFLYMDLNNIYVRNVYK